jgi:hypothetical protein
MRRVSPLGRSLEEKAAKAARKEEQQAQRAREQYEQRFARAWEAFWASPAGRARKAFRDGDHVFQYSIDVLNQQAIIVAMIGSTTAKQAADPTAVLNSVCHEGWELVNGDFVFVMEGQQSRDKFMTSGQNVAVKGTVLGYYLFKRNEANQRIEDDDALKQRLAASLS